MIKKYLDRINRWIETTTSLGWALLYILWGGLAVLTVPRAWAGNPISQFVLFVQMVFGMPFCAICFYVMMRYERREEEQLLAMRRERGSGLER